MKGKGRVSSDPVFQDRLRRRHRGHVEAAQAGVYFPRSSLVQKHQRFLRRLYGVIASDHQQNSLKERRQAAQQILESAKPSEIRAVCETTQNLLRGSFPKLNRRLLKKFAQYKSTLKKLACSTLPIEKKRVLLHKQTGYGFPLLALLGPVLAGLLLK